MRTVIGIHAAAALVLLVGCASAPETAPERRAFERRADAIVEQMTTRDPSLAPVLERAAGYVVFPEIGKAGFIAGGAHGQGLLYQNGQPVGFVELTQASLGAQAGAQSFSEIIVFRDPRAVQELKQGTFNLGAGTSAVALSAGAAAEASFQKGVAVFVMPRGGLMVDVSVSGQELRYRPMG